MKRFHALALVGVLSSIGGAAMAATGALSPFTPRYLPVLVQVNPEGKVTSVSPAIELSPVFSRLLAKNLDEMITKPAYDHGHPVSSQFVINLALRATPREEGDYDAQFAYISTSPVPMGTWHWVDVEGRRFALAGPNNHSTDGRVHFDSGRSAYSSSNFQRASSSPVQSASHSSAAAPGAGLGH
ncbi:hypothetical protein [Dyella tabacisoli]|uniref:Uncharacterized protein n=1 Tax=Dyella tabacisoli TaxID=2282381 RepID=A0A369UI64_9GAMM|nr:hypothetical protein [Dyella tabacisoli]RDD80033.1 hypothetical protein DVJ77_19365 [Dyella tabacisoli]